MSIESKLFFNKPLAPLSTFRIGGVAKLFIEVKTALEMLLVRQYINDHHLPFWILGRGSNSLFDDRGFDGLIVLNSIRFYHLKNGDLHVGAGYNFSLLGAQTARQGWSGLEFASGIPGSVGGAIFMNAGAAGFETADCLKKVVYVNSHAQLIEKSREELTFSYRYSPFHHNRGVIVSAVFELTQCTKAHERQVRMIKQRTSHQPYDLPSLGCVFCNPSEKYRAGALIEKCGLKGKRIGGAEISLRHANFIVNQKAAKARDVIELMRFIQKVVDEQTGIRLDPEIHFVPYQLGNR